MNPGKPCVAARWFEKHKGHNVVATPVEIKGLAPGQTSPLTDYKCMDCKKGLVTSKKPGYKPTKGGGMFGGMEPK